MGALRLWMLMTTRGCGWIRCMARTGRTWTRSTPSGIRPGRGSCGGAPDSVHRRRDFRAVPVLGQVHGGPVVVQRHLSLLVGVQYNDKCRCTCVMQWQVRCMVLFCAMPGSTANTCPALLVGSASHAEWRSVHSRIFSCFPSCGLTWNLDSISPSPLFFTVLRSLVRCCLRSLVDFLGALDDSQL